MGPSGVKARGGERATPPGAESRTGAPKVLAPGARVAAKMTPPLGHAATSVRSGSAATTDSNAAPAGRRVFAPAFRLAIATV